MKIKGVIKNLKVKKIKKIYEICFKNRVFFCKVIVGYKMKIKGVIKNLKMKKIKKIKNDNSKIYLGISLELLTAVWGQFSFR